MIPDENNKFEILIAVNSVYLYLQIILTQSKQDKNETLYSMTTLYIL